ncbi:zinc ribbon domain-containing protein [Oscillospiraceae bacterium PP1C4]
MVVCNKCGRKISAGSSYCSYCGVSVSSERETANLNKDRKDDFLRPFMPKKHCVECKKELPGSSISDVCAICTIRRRNRELEQQRKADSQSSSQRDRYDISDQFDQSVFQQDRAKYYREETANRFTPETTARSYKRYANPNEPGINKKKGCLMPLIVLVVISLALIVVGLIASDEYFNQSTPETTVVEEYADAPIDQQYGEQDLPRLQGESIQPAAEEEISAVVEADSITHDSGALRADGAHIYTYGTVDYYVEGELVSSDFELCLMVSGSYYLPLYLRIGEDVFYDNRNGIDRGGLITEEGVAFFEGPAGSPIFDEEPIYLSELIQSAT